MGAIVLADGGSSSVKWAVLRQGQGVVYCESPALNPLFGTPAEHHARIREALPPILGSDTVDGLYFYGAACGADQQGERICGVLQEAFPGAQVHIDSDMMAAALACWQGQAGLTAIVGTGCNAGYYDGEKMVYYTPSLGYLLGDEGSGAWIGRQLVRDWLYSYLPPELEGALNVFAGKQYGVERGENGVLAAKGIVERVYCGAQPNAFLSSFAQVAIEHRELPYCRELLRNAMTQFVRHLCVPAKRNGCTELRAVGSVAWHCRKLLAEACLAEGLHLEIVLRGPIEGLAAYWLEARMLRLS